ncbi:MAG: baseplate J/gp47 family protein, partial [Chloroflexota bacterium]
VAPTLYLGFDQALPLDERVSLWFWLANERTGREEWQRLMAELQETAVLCQPLRPQTTCIPKPPCPDPWCPPEPPAAAEEPASEAASDALAHHAIETVWEYFDGTDWLPITAVDDRTRGFTLDGAVHITLPAAMSDVALGAVPANQFYLRCRLLNGRPDAAPMLKQVAINTGLAEQARQTYQPFIIAPGVTPPAGQEPVVGVWQRMAVRVDENGRITQLAAGEDVAGPKLLVLAYAAATVGTPGSLTMTMTQIGSGTGLPEQVLVLRNAPIAHGIVQILLDEGVGLSQWQMRPDFDAAKRPDSVFVLDATTGDVVFGSGDQGRVPPAGAAVLAAYATTSGAAGNVPANSGWQLAGVDDLLNAALLGGDVVAVANELAAITNQSAGQYGSDQETLAHAAGRAAETLWAHERILELIADGQITTLDQLERTAVLDRRAPKRATTLLDYERLALTVPGSKISRARAWAGLDPHYPCLQAPGTVTVVIVPSLPTGAPQPTPALLDLVFRYLNRRRIIGTRLVVVGPEYLEVTVQAEVRTRRGADGVRVQAQIASSLNAFLDPLTGGPNGRGWPFGRDVYRSEILQVIDNVPGVDHVLSLELIPGGGEAQCANLCVGPTWLVRAGNHQVTIA